MTSPVTVLVSLLSIAPHARWMGHVQLSFLVRMANRQLDP